MPSLAVLKTSVILACTTLLLSGCGSNSRAADTAEGTSRLEEALKEVPNTHGARDYIAYGDTARLVEIYGDTYEMSPDHVLPWFRSYFAGSLFQGKSGEATVELLGIDVMSADYVLAAGYRDGDVRISGGQDETAIAEKLGSAGWKERGETWIAPNDKNVNPTDNVAEYRTKMAQVRLGGDTVTFKPATDDEFLFAPDVKESIMDDPKVSALADCLGDVALAVIRAEPVTENESLQGIAVGISMPETSDEVPHAVTCAMWDDKASAEAYTSSVEADLEATPNKRSVVQWEKVVPDSVVTRADKDRPLVRWEGDMVGSLLPLIDAVGQSPGLPGLPVCDGFSPSNRYPNGCWGHRDI